MTATDELRRLLDERGVEWHTGEIINRPEDEVTVWLADGRAVRADEHNGRLLFEAYFTPEQAVDATLGNDGVERTKNGVAERGTCHMEQADWDDGTCTWGCICSACGEKFEHETGKYWHYCPKCGAEVVE